MRTKITIYVVLLISIIVGLFYLLGISFFMFFGKRGNIEIDKAIDNQLKINCVIFFILIGIVFFLISRIRKLNIKR